MLRMLRSPRQPPRRWTWSRAAGAGRSSGSSRPAAVRRRFCIPRTKPSADTLRGRPPRMRIGPRGPRPCPAPCSACRCRGAGQRWQTERADAVRRRFAPRSSGSVPDRADSRARQSLWQGFSLFRTWGRGNKDNEKTVAQPPQGSGWPHRPAPDSCRLPGGPRQPISLRRRLSGTAGKSSRKWSRMRSNDSSGVRSVRSGP